MATKTQKKKPIDRDRLRRLGFSESELSLIGKSFYINNDRYIVRYRIDTGEKTPLFIVNMTTKKYGSSLYQIDDTGNTYYFDLRETGKSYKLSMTCGELRCEERGIKLS